MLRYLKLYFLFIRVSIQNDTAYRFDFIVRLIIAAAQAAGELITLWIIFSNTQSLGGWSVNQALVVLGVFRVMAGIIGTLIAPNMRLIMEDVRNGTLDFVLVKPINDQFYASVRRVTLYRIADMTLGFTMVIIGCVRLTSHVALWSIPLFVLKLVAGAAIIYSFWLALATLAFWFTKISNIEMIFWNMFEAGRYPVDIYPPGIRSIFTYILPLAFMISFPAASLVGKGEASQLIAAMIVAPAMLFASSAFWKHGLRHYSGASA